MEMLIASGVVALAVFGCLGGWVASQKGRRPVEGLSLGFLFGPFGVLIESLLPSVARKSHVRPSQRRRSGRWDYAAPPKADPAEEQAAAWISDELPKRIQPPSIPD